MNLVGKITIIIVHLFLYVPSSAQNFDIDLLRDINHNETQFKTDFYHGIGKSVTYVNIATPLGVFISGLAKHDKKQQIDAAYIGAAYIFSSVSTHALKKIINRDRPFEKYPDIIKRDAGGGGSFPSGHTSAAFTSATSLSLYFPKWYVIVPSYLWASTAAYGRLYQGVHYPSDVLAGAVVGAGSAWLSYKVQKWHDKKMKARKSEPATKISF
jgi:membrane-associated phospholipid phosphatase